MLCLFTKSLAAYHLVKADKYKQLFSNGTSRRQTSIQNLIISTLSDAGYREITLSSGTIAKDETTVSITTSIDQTFKEDRALLHGWRENTEYLFPSHPDLLDILPNPSKLTLAKLADDTVVSTDNCKIARKFQQLIIEKIKAEAKEL